MNHHSYSLKSFKIILKEMNPKNRECQLYIAVITFQSERYEDMLDAMSKVLAQQPRLTRDERNALDRAYKKTIGSRLTAWKTLSQIQKKGEPKKIDLLRGYKTKIEDELNRYCNQIINLINSALLKEAQNIEAKIFYNKMKGDYFRQVIVYTSGAQREKAAEKALQAYEVATEDAKNISATHPTRLSLALSYSKFYCEVKNDLNTAIKLGKSAFDDAIQNLEELEPNNQTEMTKIMQYIRDNLILWTQNLEQ